MTDEAVTKVIPPQVWTAVDGLGLEVRHDEGRAQTITTLRDGSVKLVGEWYVRSSRADPSWRQ